MLDKNKLSPLAVALGATFAISLSVSPVVNAADNPFNMTDLGSGYMVAEEGKCGDMKDGEHKCGDMKDGEGKCGEGKCGDKKKADGKCGEGKCGDNKK